MMTLSEQERHMYEGNRTLAFFNWSEGEEPDDILRELLKQHNQRAIDFRTVSRWARAARDLGHHGERQLRALEMFANVVLYTEAKGTW